MPRLRSHGMIGLGYSQNGLAHGAMKVIWYRTIKKGPCHHEPFSKQQAGLHGVNDRLAELRAAQQCRTVHQALEVIGDGPLLDGAIHASR